MRRLWLVAVVGGLIGCASAGLIRRDDAAPTSFNFNTNANSVVVVVCAADKSLGGGVILSRGTIISMNHVVGSCDEVELAFRTGFVTKGRVVVRDKEHDLARITPDAMPEIFNAAQIEVNTPSLQERLHFISHPDGLVWSYAEARMGALFRRDLTVNDVGDKVAAWQVNTMACGGSSGGGLFNDDGQLVGVGMGLIRGTGIAFFVPAADVCQKLINCKVSDKPADATGGASE